MVTEKGRHLRNRPFVIRNHVLSDPLIVFLRKLRNRRRRVKRFSDLRSAAAAHDWYPVVDTMDRVMTHERSARMPYNGSRRKLLRVLFPLQKVSAGLYDGADDHGRRNEPVRQNRFWPVPDLDDVCAISRRSGFSANAPSDNFQVRGFRDSEEVLWLSADMLRQFAGRSWNRQRVFTSRRPSVPGPQGHPGVGHDCRPFRVNVWA